MESVSTPKLIETERNIVAKVWAKAFEVAFASQVRLVGFFDPEPPPSIVEQGSNARGLVEEYGSSLLLVGEVAQRWVIKA